MKPLLTRFSLYCLLWLSALAGYGQSLSISVNPNVICLGQAAQISAVLSSGLDPKDVTSYVISFGHPGIGIDTFVSNVGSPVTNSTFHQYAAAGAYKIRITANFSNRGPISNEMYDTVYNPPIAKLALTNLDSQCFKGNSYCFKNLSLRALFPSLPVTTMVISYSDGDSTTVPAGGDVCHVFKQGNSKFYPAIAVVDAGGCNAKSFETIYVAPNINAQFSLSGTPQCDTTPYIFVNTTPVSLTDVLWFKWYYGDDSVYMSPNPIINGSGVASRWNSFTYLYTKAGVFNPILVVQHRRYHCKDSFVYSSTNNPLPENIVLQYDIRSRRVLGSDTIADSVCFDNLNKGSLNLYNNYSLQGTNAQIQILWDFADPNASPPGSDKFLNRVTPTYQYKGLGHFFPKLYVFCPGKPVKRIDFWSRIDTARMSDTQYVPRPVGDPSNPGPLLINTIRGYQFKALDPIAQNMYIFNTIGPDIGVTAADPVLNVFTSPGHGLANGDLIRFTNAGSVNGLNLSYNYIVNAASSNTFKILVGAPGSFPNISLGSPPFNPAAFKRVNQAPFDSITDYYKWFKKDISKLNYQKFRSNLRGYGINIMGPMVQVEDPNAKPPVVINPFLKSQCGPDFPVEFTNATNVYQSNNLYIKWDFADDYAPKCTSFSVGGPKPYINGTDLLAKTTGRYITGGVVYPGRVNCKYSHDTLPIHSYVNWNQIFIWFKYGHDFPPFDTSANGWTKDISKVTWPNGPGTYPSGRKLVHPSDSATWNIPIYSAGPTTSRLDTFTRIWPADKLPNSTITLANPIPDPFAIGKGYNRATIGQGTIIDSGSFVTPLLSPLPDKSTRRYRGSYLLPGNSSKTLYQYAFKRGVTDKYTVRLTMRDSFNNQSDDPYKTYTRINMIAGKITIVQKTDTTPGFPVIHTSSEYSANSIPPSIVNDTLIYNYKAYKVYTDPSTSQKYVLIKDDEFFVDYFDCGSTATVELPLVEADAYGLGYEGRICPGLNRETGANPTLHFDPINGAPGLYPPSKDRTYLLVNFDSILDRHDLTPCALDGFVDWNAISPMTGTNVTLGGKTFPPFNKGVDFGGPTKWLNATDASIDVVHYQPQGNWAFDTRPYASNGYVTIGIIIGNGHAFPGSSLPGCISDTVWYHNFWHFVVLNASFTYRKVGGYSTYNSATITGSPSVLPSQDYTYDTTKTSGTYFEPWSRLFGKGDILEFETQIKRQDFIMADYWDWRDGYITIDSFYTNVGDTFVHLKPSNPNDSTFFLKNTFPIDRIRHEYNTDVPPGDLIQVRSYRPYPIGINVFDTIIAETIWQCNDLTHQLPPQSITQNPIRIDSGFFVHPIRHQFRKSSWETEYPGGLGRIGNIEGQPIEHSIYTYDTCYFKTTRYIIIGVIDTFTIKGNDNILCVGESGEFTDSIIYWTPNSNGAVNPSRPLPPGVTETVDVFMHRLDMRNYPVDTIKTFANPTKKGKIDTAFYARIYWDFESDGLIDHAGSNPTHKFNLPGRFKVSMITRDTVGYWDTCFMFVDVVEPHAHFTSKKIFTCSDPTNFNDSSYVKDDCYLRTGTSCDQVKNIKWWFGDIGYGPNDWRSTVKNPLYPYRKNGWYRLQETILTDQGCVDTFRKDIYIAGPRPRIKLLGDTIGCAPYKLRILSYPNDSGGISSTGATYFEFGRPDFRYNIAAYNNPDTVTVVYDEEGVYTIRATGYDKFPGNLCKGIMLPDTVDGFENAIKIYVKNPYRVKVAVTKKEVCVGEIFKVLNLSNRDTITKFRLYTYNSDTAIIDTLYKTNFPADTFFQYVFNQAGVYSLVLHSTRFKLGSPECESKDTVKVIARRAKADLKIDSLGLPKFFITNLSDSINGSGYIWRIYNPDGGLRTELVVPNNASQYFNYGLLDLKNDIGEFKVCIVATTSLLQNCNDSVCKTVINNFQTEINIPNVFTPDGNGVNDEFEIKIKGEELYDLKIWNRWGGEVFESTDSKKMWNGHTQNNGAENPDGTYYFIFKYRLRTNQEQIVRGTITLIRN